MATQVQFRRGTTAQNNSFTGALGEVTVDTDKDTLVVHDGGTAGGFEISRADASNLKFPDGAVGTPAISFASDTNTGIYRGGTDILKFVTAGTDAITIDASQDVTLAGSINFADNEKAIFGAGSDLQIYHDSANGNSYIQDAGTGQLRLEADSVAITNTGHTEFVALFNENADVKLYYDGSEKLATTATGIDVTGNITLGDGHFIGDQAVSDNLLIQSSSGENIGYDSGNGTHLFYNNGTETARLSDTGHLSIGKTGTGISSAGHSLKADGTLEVRRDIATANTSSVGYISRGTSDGNILTFYKDTTSVGSIASRAGSVSTIILDPSATGGGISGGGSALYPTDHAGTLSDGALTLGDASYRWNNLYLSGGVYLGGTGSANKLDDYEEGTFVVGITATTGTLGLGATTNTLSYTKIGQVVHFRGYINVNTFSGASGTVEITGFPFAVADLTKFSERPSILIGVLGSSDDGAKYGIMTATNTKITMQGFNASSLDSDVDLYLSGSYPTS